MAKLTNNVEYQNIHFPKDRAEYLLSNGFACERLSSDTLQFVKGNICLIVKNDCVDFFRYEPEHLHDRTKFQQSHTGIHQLDGFGWIMLLSIMGVQKANHRSLIPA